MSQLQSPTCRNRHALWRSEEGCAGEEWWVLSCSNSRGSGLSHLVSRVAPGGWKRAASAPCGDLHPACWTMCRICCTGPIHLLVSVAPPRTRSAHSCSSSSWLPVPGSHHCPNQLPGIQVHQSFPPIQPEPFVPETNPTPLSYVRLSLSMNKTVIQINSHHTSRHSNPYVNLESYFSDVTCFIIFHLWGY